MLVGVAGKCTLEGFVENTMLSGEGTDGWLNKYTLKERTMPAFDRSLFFMHFSKGHLPYYI